jgi:hypothetical protein
MCLNNMGRILSTSLCLILILLSISLSGQELNRLSLTLFGDSIISKNGEIFLELKIKSNANKHFSIFKDWVSIDVFNEIDTPQINCVINENGNKYEDLYIGRSIKKVRIKRNNVYMVGFNININELCWNKDRNNIKKYFVRGSYWDVKSESFLFSETKVLTLQ